jgi:L-rhamnose mutarotase
MMVLTTNLKGDPAVVETYRRYHREVWPEVLASLRRVGVERMDIHLLGRRLVMVVEMRDGLDYRAAFRSHATSSPRVIEWEQLMKSLQEPPPEAKPGEWWAVMEPVFHLDRGTDAPAPRQTQEPGVAHIADQARTS